MEIFDAPLGPLVLVQLVTPATPVMPQVPAAVGAAAPDGPVTVAVKEIVDPRDAVAESGVTITVGVAFVTEVELPEVGDVAE